MSVDPQNQNQGPPTILLADDDLAVQRVLGTLLTRAGYTVIIASSGEEAVQVVQSQTTEIDLVVLDDLMVRMNGFEAYRQIQTLHPGIPALFILAFFDEIPKEFRVQLGLASVLLKPFSGDNLLDSIRALLPGALPPNTEERSSAEGDDS